MSAHTARSAFLRHLRGLLHRSVPIQALVRGVIARELRAFCGDSDAGRRAKRIRRMLFLSRASADEVDLGAEIGGFRLVFPSRSDIGLAIALGKSPFEALPALLDAAVTAREPVVCEVGSNLGATLIQLLRSRPDAKVHAFEPSPRFLPYLRRVVELNRLSGVTVIASLVGDRTGTARLSSNTTTATAVSEAEFSGLSHVETEEVASTTLDAYFSGGPAVDFLKIDTDGYDFAVLLGARRLLERDRPTLYFELAPELIRCTGREPLELFDYLASLGYGPFGVLSNQGAPLGVLAGGTEVLELFERHPHRGYPYFDVVVSGRSAPPVAELLGRLR